MLLNLKTILHKAVPYLSKFWSFLQTSIGVVLIGVLVGGYFTAQYLTRSTVVNETATNVSQIADQQQKLSNIVEELRISEEEIKKVVVETIPAEIDVSDIISRLEEQEKRISLLEQGTDILTDVNADLTGDIEAQINKLNETVIEADIDGEIEDTQDNVETIEETLEKIYEAMEIRDAVIASLTSILTIVNEELQEHILINHAFVPLGGIVWVTGDNLPDEHFFANCDGASVNGGVLPDINADGLFVRGGDYDGIVNADTTAVNGLENALNGQHAHTYDKATTGGFTAKNDFVPDLPFSTYTNGTSDTSGQHIHVLSGDSETAPKNIKAKCFVRIN